MWPDGANASLEGLESPKGSVKRAAPPLRAIAGRARRHPVAFSVGSPEWPVNPPTWFDERGQPARISDSA